jgi:CheY-like chemotaxis protein
MVPTKDARLRGVHALIVDDSRDLAFSYARVLEIYGATASRAHCMKDALKILVNVTPDVLLCDLAMPEGDGCELVRAVRAIESGTRRHLPAVAITGKTDELSMAQAFAAGFDYFIVKPIDLERLVLLVEELWLVEDGILDHSWLHSANDGRKLDARQTPRPMPVQP